MILSGSFEFWKIHNAEIVERPSDDEEVRLVRTTPVPYYFIHDSQFVMSSMIILVDERGVIRSSEREEQGAPSMYSVQYKSQSAHASSYAEDTARA